MNFRIAWKVIFLCLSLILLSMTSLILFYHTNVNKIIVDYEVSAFTQRVNELGDDLRSRITKVVEASNASSSLAEFTELVQLESDPDGKERRFPTYKKWKRRLVEKISRIGRTCECIIVPFFKNAPISEVPPDHLFDHHGFDQENIAFKLDRLGNISDVFVYRGVKANDDDSDFSVVGTMSLTSAVSALKRSLPSSFKVFLTPDLSDSHSAKTEEKETVEHIVYIPIGDKQIRFGVIASKQQVTAQATKIRNQSLLVGSGVLVVGIIFAIIFTRLITTPLEKMTSAANRHQVGEVWQYKRNSKDEIGQLNQSFKNLIEDRDNNQSQLEEARRNAEKANHAKSRFVANISHEIRTPLNAIAGVTDFLEEIDNPDSEYQQYLSILRNANSTLLGLINNVLDFSKVEENKLVLDRQPTDILKLVDATIDVVKPLVKDKNLVILPDVAIEGDVFMLDGPKLQQILLNLLSNAIKFTEAGTISLSIKSGGSDRITVSVKDSGIGMSDEQIENIFEPFKQADETINNAYGGTGLGLSISKKMVELMDGILEVFSQPNQGSTFSFDILAPKTEKKNERIEVQRDLKSFIGFSALVVDDLEQNRFILGKHLQSLGMDVKSALNGEDAVLKVEGATFDIIFMDMQMPVLNGYDATRKIRNFEKAEKLTPIVAVTANVVKEYINRCFDAGCSDYIPKPIRKENLLRVLNSHLAVEDNISKLNTNNGNDPEKDISSQTNAIDMDVVREIQDLADDDDPDLLAEQIDGFFRKADCLVKQIKLQFMESRLSELETSAHALAGSASTIGAYPLQQYCNLLESACSGADAAAIEELVSKIENAYKFARNVLHQIEKKAS